MYVYEHKGVAAAVLSEVLHLHGCFFQNHEASAQLLSHAAHQTFNNTEHSSPPFTLRKSYFADSNLFLSIGEAEVISLHNLSLNGYN